jgi:hypothetical protein
MAHTLGSGDRLAQGAIKATYLVRDEKPISDEKWEEMFPKKAVKPVEVFYMFKCPVHGIFLSTKKCFLKGGYPQLDESKTSKCRVEDCDEVSVYADYKK